MRVTIEISDDQHQSLSALAQRRGVRGFSVLVQEAIEVYLADLAADEVDHLLSLEGTLTDDDAKEVRARVDAVRSAWRVA